MTGQPVELTDDECGALLRGGVVGRVAYVTADGPRVQPVNYAVHGEAVVFRTRAGSELASVVSDGDLAFEIDHLDHEKQQGWSVVAVGAAEVVDDADAITAIRQSWNPRPWAAGERGLYVRLRWRLLSGRRLGDDWTFSSLMPYRRHV
jgi:nitroimidazol reductase NimA-like FMN-containing flavoprotein (pyridoxamine 5'-phosphate oxidase superfamily)